MAMSPNFGNNFNTGAQAGGAAANLAMAIGTIQMQKQKTAADEAKKQRDLNNLDAWRAERATMEKAWRTSGALPSQVLAEDEALLGKFGIPKGKDFYRFHDTYKDEWKTDKEYSYKQTERALKQQDKNVEANVVRAKDVEGSMTMATPAFEQAYQTLNAAKTPEGQPYMATEADAQVFRNIKQYGESGITPAALAKPLELETGKVLQPLRDEYKTLAIDQQNATGMYEYLIKGGVSPKDAREQVKFKFPKVEEVNGLTEKLDEARKLRDNGTLTATQYDDYLDKLIGGAKPPTTTVNVNNSPEGKGDVAFAEADARTKIKILEDGKGKAEDASKLLYRLEVAKNSANDKAWQGKFADQKLEIAKGIKSFGGSVNDAAIQSTEKLKSDLGLMVAAQLKATFGAQMTVQEGEKLEKWQGSINTDPAALQNILSLAEDVAQRNISTHNDNVDKVQKERPKSSMDFYRVKPQTKTSPISEVPTPDFYEEENTGRVYTIIQGRKFYADKVK